MVSSSASHVWLPEGIPYRFPSSGFLIGKKPKSSTQQIFWWIWHPFLWDHRWFHTILSCWNGLARISGETATLAFGSVNIPFATDATGFGGPFLGLDLTWAIGALPRCGAGKTDLFGLCGLAWAPLQKAHSMPWFMSSDYGRIRNGF